MGDVIYAHRLNVNVFPVALGQQISETELRGFASEPVSDHFIRMDAISSMPEWVEKIAAFSCNEPVDALPATPFLPAESAQRHRWVACAASLSNGVTEGHATHQQSLSAAAGIACSLLTGARC